jgi:3'(2'), 5'-bisphosphate nucleotidase
MGGSESTETQPADANEQENKKPYTKESKVAVEAVIKGCEVAQSVAGKLITNETITKKDNSPVTIADFSVQAVVITYIKRAFPQDPIVAEEKSKNLEAKEMREKVCNLTNSVLPQPGLTEEEVIKAIDEGGCEGGSSVPRFWALDPIDGTKGFLRAEQYAVCLALIENGEVVLGVLGCPNLPLDMTQPDGKKGCVFMAVKGSGALMRSLEPNDEFKKISVSNSVDPKQTPFLESVEAGHSSHDDAGQIAKLLKITAPPLRMDSQCKYAALARGDAAIYLRLPTSATYQEKIWDHAAGCLIVKEAGGDVADTTGTPLDFTVGRTLAKNKGVVATNKAVHHQVLGAVELVLYPPTQSFKVTIKRIAPDAPALQQAICSSLSIPPSLVSVEALTESSSSSSSTSHAASTSTSASTPKP